MKTCEVCEVLLPGKLGAVDVTGEYQETFLVNCSSCNLSLPIQDCTCERTLHSNTVSCSHKSAAKLAWHLMAFQLHEMEDPTLSVEGKTSGHSRNYAQYPPEATCSPAIGGRTRNDFGTTLLLFTVTEQGL